MGEEVSWFVMPVLECRLVGLEAIHGREDVLWFVVLWAKDVEMSC